MKYTITVEEKIRYVNEIKVELPEGMTRNDFDKILDKIERENRTTGDVSIILENKYGIKVIKCDKNFPDNPHDWEIEITEMDEIKDGEENE